MNIYRIFHILVLNNIKKLKKKPHFKQMINNNFKYCMYKV